MTAIAQTRQFDADEAVAIYEDALSYFVPQDTAAAAAEADDALVEYSEAA
ncbi:hypothetical protein [Mangrovicoccus algicola]|uniref:Uncharacterized protein n=1 Tax=Mangrovicoccus algicola TaxID=2771008 RepID=A0A8J7CIM9_9RHOB|nr:hypothetical protein [Mangrovicoccus algicola]MBE3636676.1 hypothetical protein [Mangrovicoccus algicola]